MILGFGSRRNVLNYSNREWPIELSETPTTTKTRAPEGLSDWAVNCQHSAKLMGFFVTAAWRLRGCLFSIEWAKKPLK